jgi:hypothetical protein
MTLLIVAVALLTLVIVEAYFASVRRRSKRDTANATTGPPEATEIQ